MTYDRIPHGGTELRGESDIVSSDSRLLGRLAALVVDERSFPWERDRAAGEHGAQGGGEAGDFVVAGRGGQAPVGVEGRDGGRFAGQLVDGP